MKTFKPNSKMSHGGHYCWGGKVMKKAKGGSVSEPAADRLIGKQYDPKTSAIKKKILENVIPDEIPIPTKAWLTDPLIATGVAGYQTVRKLYEKMSGAEEKSDAAKKKLKDMEDDYSGDSLGTPEEGYAAKEHAYKRGGKVKPFWKTKSPKKTSKPLTPSQKASAKARAAKAGRPYPNLIDNAAASRRGK